MNSRTNDEEILNEVKNLLKFILIKRKENEYYVPKLWNMDTNVLKILKQFVLHYEKNSNWNKIIFKKLSCKNEKNNDVYKIYDENHTEILVYDTKPKAWSTIRQYMQVLMEFEIISSKKIDKSNNTFSFDITLVSIIPELYQDSEDYYLKGKIKNIILNLVNFEQNQYVLNCSFSILIILLKKANLLDNNAINFYLKDNDLKNIFIFKASNKKAQKIDNNKINGYFLQDIKFNEYISKMENETYKNIKEKFNYDEIIHLINDFNDWTQSFIESKDTNENKVKQNNMKAARRSFRKLLIDNRRELGLITTTEQDEEYSEFENNEKSSLELLEAAHIISFSKLRNLYINEKDEQGLKTAEDPYNGLLLEPSIHTYFDKGYITFNLNGEIIKNEETKNVEAIDNLVNMKLRLNKIILEKIKNNIFEYNNN